MGLTFNPRKKRGINLEWREAKKQRRMLRRSLWVGSVD
jgi:hypothetical protein